MFNGRPVAPVGRPLETICGHVSIRSEWRLNDELKFVHDFNSAFRRSGQRRHAWCCGPFRRLFEGKCDEEMLRGAKWTAKLAEICFCLLALCILPFAGGVYGERGVALALASIGLCATLAILGAKLRTLNRCLTAQHWFIMESLTYGLLALSFLLCALTLAALRLRHWALRQAEASSSLETEAAASPTLACICAAVLSICAAIYGVDVWLVWSARAERTWMPAHSQYRI